MPPLSDSCDTVKYVKTLNVIIYIYEISLGWENQPVFIFKGIGSTLPDPEEARERQTLKHETIKNKTYI